MMQVKVLGREYDLPANIYHVEFCYWPLTSGDDAAPVKDESYHIDQHSAMMALATKPRLVEGYVERIYLKKLVQDFTKMHTLGYPEASVYAVFNKLNEEFSK